MRSVLSLAAILLVAFLAPGAAGVGPLCLPSCDVPSQTTGGFLPPVTFVQSGGEVTWSTLDSVHTASEETDLCFHVTYYPGGAERARFEIVDGALFAANEGAELAECTAALTLPDRSFAIDYVCFYHPSSMTGKIVVK